VKIDTETARQRRTPIDERYAAFRYVLAWGLRKYVDLTPDANAKITEFLRAFREGFPEQYRIASEVTAAIQRHDVFTVAGHRRVVEEVLGLWGLEHLVEFKN
jgi:hypothetical protein